MKFLKKYHKWLGIIATFFILLFSTSGIILNHRKSLSNININRNWLPQQFQYNHWNNTAIKGFLELDKDSILIYGNIGIWKTNTSFSEFEDFNQGFLEGIDNRKICKLFKTQKGDLFAGTFFGLYQYNFQKKLWQEVTIPVHHKRITDIIEKDNSLFILTRSLLLISKDYKTFTKQMLHPPEDYDNQISLFRTLWFIHSGEIYGITGKIFVDIIAVIFIFITITGFIFFTNKLRIKHIRNKYDTNTYHKKNDKDEKISSIKKTNRWNLKWHNKIGWTTFILLTFTTITGMFLRPPLLIPIADVKISKIPHTELAQVNPWFDKLRRILFDKNNKRFIIATLDGFYYTDENFSSALKKFKIQPPASIMGVTVFRETKNNTFLIGSFEGLFEWNPSKKQILNYITKKNYVKPLRKGPPVGKNMVTAYTQLYNHKEIFFDYRKGAQLITTNHLLQKKAFVNMPKYIQKQPISLWNLALEIHTGRIFQFIIGKFYILIVPLVGLSLLFVLISGFIIWYKKYRKKK